MPRKQTTTKTSTTKTTKSEAKPRKATNAKQPQRRKKAEPVEEVVEESHPEVVEEHPAEPENVDNEDGQDGQDGQAGRQKRKVTRDSVMESFDELVTLVEAEITRLRENPGKAKGVKFLRSLGKRVKTLRNDTARVMKHRQRTNRPRNTNSGFMKPVAISTDMAKFAGWDPSELKSRVDVTKYICNYIKENNLQNPEDRRQILADKNLCKLLRYDSKKGDPLTYYKLQKHIQHHFPQQQEVKA